MYEIMRKHSGDKGWALEYTTHTKAEAKAIIRAKARETLSCWTKEGGYISTLDNVTAVIVPSVGSVSWYYEKVAK